MVDEQGGQLGVMSTRDALELAREHELDLVEVASNSVPPVCRLLDYGKFRYLQSTKEKEMRRTQKNTGLREVLFRPRIGRHIIGPSGRHCIVPNCFQSLHASTVFGDPWPRPTHQPPCSASWSH